MKNSKFLGMKIAITVTRNTEFQFSPAAICMPQTIAITLILRIFMQIV